MARDLAILTIVFALAAVLVGCSGDSDGSSAAEDASRAAADVVDAAEAARNMAKERVSEGSRQLQGRDGATLPEGLPIYPGAVSSSEVPDSDLFRWDTADPVPVVGDFYAEALGSEPWGLFSSNRMSVTAQVFVFKQARQTIPMGRVSLEVGRGGKGTTILLDLN